MERPYAMLPKSQLREREGVVGGGEGDLTRFLHGTDCRFGPAQLAKGRLGAGSLAAFRMQLQRLQRGTRTAPALHPIFCCSAQPGFHSAQPASPSFRLQPMILGSLELSMTRRAGERAVRG